MSREVQSCIPKAALQNDVKVVEVPPANLKRRLVSNPAYDHMINAINLAQRIATSNGYIADVPRRPGLIARREYATVVDSNKINFCPLLLFITDDLTIQPDEMRSRGPSENCGNTSNKPQEAISSKENVRSLLSYSRL
ncbi:hypothetical protein RB195_004041 [Necator americanus]|uniref:Uncharacterized protein n=1 Tax=Necator americanus TaxID=51031 RepID=A0ABR1BHV4_NECAM